jgi:hypothetical protein
MYVNVQNTIIKNRIIHERQPPMRGGQHHVAIHILGRFRKYCLRPLFAKGKIMLYTIAVVLLILWVLGLVTSYTIGGFIHVLLVVAIVMVLLRVISGRGV